MDKKAAAPGQATPDVMKKARAGAGTRLNVRNRNVGTTDVGLKASGVGGMPRGCPTT